MFEEWAGKTIPKDETASISFRNAEWNNEGEYINHTDEYMQQKNVIDNKLQDKNIGVGDRYYLKEENDVMPIYPKLNPGDKIKMLSYESQPDERKYIWSEKLKKLCGCFITIKKYEETKQGYFTEEIDDWCLFKEELEYSTLIRAKNIQDNQTKANPEYPQLFPGDKIMIKPFDKQPRKNNDWIFDAKNICGKVVTIKDYDEIKKVYHLEESDYRWFADELDFSRLIRINTNNYQDITNPTKEDFNNLQPGDLVLLKSVKDCNAECWLWHARDCCGNWVTVQSRLPMNERMYFAIKDNSDDETYVKFEWISAIRKKV